MDVLKRYILLIWFIPILAIGAVNLDEAERLITQKQAAKAFALLEKDFEALAGEPRYDFLYGLAALDSGHPHEATFAFERVLISEPENHQARLQLGRAYFTIGDYAAASAEFAEVLAYNPPADVKANIQKFFTAMGVEEVDLSLRATGFVGAGLGLDSNINSATASGTVNVPALGPVILDPESVSRSDQFTLLKGGVTLLKPLGKNSAVYSRATLELKDNLDDQDFDTNILDLVAGYATSLGKYSLRLPLVHQNFQFSNRTFRRIYAFDPEIARQVGDNHELSIFGEWGAFRYPKDETFNVDIYLGGLSWLYTQPNKYFQNLSRIYYGDEDSHDGGDKFNSRHLVGAQIYTLFPYFPSHTPYLRVTYQKARHNAEHPIFDKTRRDDFFYFGAGWDWEITSKVLFKLEGSYTKNHSSIELFNYDRELVQFTLQYLFG